VVSPLVAYVIPVLVLPHIPKSRCIALQSSLSQAQDREKIACITVSNELHRQPCHMYGVHLRSMHTSR
jgi:hypothetical protein